MKYTRLTKEQFEALHQEFAVFLAALSIDKKAWKTLKATDASAAEKRLDEFSDVVWDRVLSNVTYVENHSADRLFLFRFDEEAISLILIKSHLDTIDLTTVEGLAWLESALHTDAVSVYTSSKAYSEDTQMDKFRLIQQGSIITEGLLFRNMEQVMG